MALIKMLIVLIIGTVTWDIVKAGSIKVRLNLVFNQTFFDVTYNLNGEQSTKSSRDTLTKDTIKIPDAATNINLTAYRTWTTNQRQVIFSQFYDSVGEKCFAVNELYPPHWYEEPCQELPISGAYSISVHSHFFLMTLRGYVTYEYNGSNFTSTGEFNYVAKPPVQIPDAAKNILFSLYVQEYESYEMGAKAPTAVLTKFYPLPVKKCYEIHGRNITTDWFERPCQKLPALKGNNISVQNTGIVRLLMKMNYEYEGSNFTDYAENIGGSQNGTIQIPDNASKINFTIYQTSSWGNLMCWGPAYYELLFSQVFPSPVQKCFKVENGVVTPDGCLI